MVRRASLYKSYSMFFSNGRAFSVMRGNASSPHDEVWFPLSFDHDRRTYSSYLTNARFEPALLCFRSDQRWVNMLLPDIYHGRYVVPPPYGGLKGDLAIFLALIAFAIPMDRLQQDLPAMFHTGAWQQYEMGNGSTYSRGHQSQTLINIADNAQGDHQRGVVVEIWTYPGRYGGSSTDDIVAFEENGMYYP